MTWKIKLRTISKFRKLILLLAILILIVGSLAVIIRFRYVHQQNETGLILANRQLSLIEQMIGHVMELKTDLDDRAQHLQSLQTAADTFEQTLWALINGGQVPYLPDQPADVVAVRDPELQLSLHQVHHTWDIFRGYLNEIRATDPADPELTTRIEAVTRLSPRLVQETAGVVEQYQTTMEEENVLFWWVVGALCGTTLLLIGGSYQVSRNTLLAPLRALQSVADRLAQGDLNTPIMVTGPREIEAISHSLDTMRTQLQVSQSEMRSWTNRLESRVRKRASELETIFEASQEIVDELDLEQLLTSITARAKSLTGAQAVRLCLMDGNGKDMIAAAASGDFPDPADCQQPSSNRPTIELINLTIDGSVEMPCQTCAFPQNDQARHCLITPLRVGESIIGGLCVARTVPKKFDQDETRALSLLANSAAIAISNAWLVEAGRRQAEKVAALVERERLAADLHDHLAQTLGSLKLEADQLQALLSAGQGVEAKNQLDLVQDVLNQAYLQVRTALVDLRDSNTSAGSKETDSAGATKSLAEELETCLAEFQENSTIPAYLDIVDLAVLTLLPSNARLQALHIVREALHNARRHAQAQHIWVRVEQSVGGQELCFSIKDDGRGFDPAEVNGQNHLGLAIMRARAARSGAHLKIHSQIDVGTKIIARFPLETATYN